MLLGHCYSASLRVAWWLLEYHGLPAVLLTWSYKQQDPPNTLFTSREKDMQRQMPHQKYTKEYISIQMEGYY